MTHPANLNIIRHFSLLNDIILFGKTEDMYFICLITKIENRIKHPNCLQNEACIYIKHDRGIYYCIQVTLLPDTLIDVSNKQMNELLMELLKKYAKKIYKNLKKSSSEMIVKETNNKFIYYLYDIPAYIWCVAVGMITAKL